MPSFLLERAGLFALALWRRVAGRHPALRTGKRSLHLPGLEREVWICRDECGVPQVYAETLGDLGFGLGVATAQDRLWQMEMLRRLAGGRLAEVMGDRRLGGASLHLPGPTVLAVDHLYRSLRMYPVAREERSLVSQDGETAIGRFAAGVNAWVAGCRSRDLPPEFLLAGLRPEPWTPEDSIAVGKLIGWLLSLGFAVKPVLASLATHPGLRPILPPDLAQGVCILENGLPLGAASLDLQARQALGLTGPGVGSNSWVISGVRTASGKPLLCNDPHLVFGLPAFWYPVALHGPAHRVIGVTIPGIPAVLVGRNEHAAWGFTAAMADDGDYYRETLDETGTRYLRDGTWQPVEPEEEAFRVRGRSEATRRTLRYVRHEGVLCPLLPHVNGGPPTSFRWVGLEPWRGLEAILGMNLARSVSEVEAALQHFALPAQNVVVADRQGTIAYFCAGKFPRRPWAGTGPGILDGASPAHAWRGYLTWVELPKVFNPPAGFLVTANNRVAPDLPSTIGCGFWEPAYRATRIAALLDRCPTARVEDMARIQTDVLSVQAAGILTHLVRPMAERLQDPRARQAACLLLAWDCAMLADSAPAALYHLFYQELLQACFRPVMEEQVPGLFARYFSLLHLAVPAADGALLRGDSAWFPAGLGATVERCLAAAWDRAMARLGADPTGWKWGRLHTLTLWHGMGRGRRFSSRALAWLLDLNRGPYPRPGDGMTVNLAAFPLTEPFAIGVGPSYRQIVDLGSPDKSQWIIAGGTSGDPRSPHYADQVEAWLSGTYRPMRFRSRAEAGDGIAVHLRPGS
jgi:penicillin amidase